MARSLAHIYGPSGRSGLHPGSGSNLPDSPSRAERTDGFSSPPGTSNGLTIVDAIFAALALLSVLPSLLVRYPQSVDYLNHLARLFVLTAPADDPIHAFYRVHWHLVPNLGLELLAVPLSALLPLEAALKLVWVVCILGPAAALWFLQRSIWGRSQPTLVLGAIVLINLPLTVGLLSFMLGLALALAAIAWWFRWGDRATARSLLMLNALGAAIFVTHVAACASLVVTIAALHVLRRPYRVVAMLHRAAMIGLGFVLPLLLMIFAALSPAAPSGTGDPDAIIYKPWWKLQLATAPMFTGDFQADIVVAMVLWISLLVTVLLGARCHHRFVAPLLVWLVLLLALPFRIGSASIIDLRQAIFPALLLIGAISFAPQKRGWSAAIMGIGVACVVGRIAVLMPEWRLHDAQVESFREIDGVVESGAKVLVASAPEAPGTCREPHRWAPFDEHTPVLLTIDRAAFVSTLFAKPDLQPIEPTAPVRDIAEPDLGIVLWTDLVDDRGSAAANSSSRYTHDWQEHYDYLALRRLNCAAEIATPANLVPMAESMTYRLYRIMHTTR